MQVQAFPYHGFHSHTSSPHYSQLIKIAVYCPFISHLKLLIDSSSCPVWCWWDLVLIHLFGLMDMIGIDPSGRASHH